MLDAVFDAESLEEDNEVPEVFDEVVVAFVGLDVAQEDYVVGRLSMPLVCVRTTTAVENVGSSEERLMPLLYYL